jgi:hypothetical protein
MMMAAIIVDISKNKRMTAGKLLIFTAAYIPSKIPG